MNKREFGFDHLGRGPNDRYRVFKNSDLLRKFLRYRAPFAVYSSVAFYKKPWKRGEWLKSELVFDVDAKDLPVRSCNCDSVCEICLDEALQIVGSIIDVLKEDLGLKNVHVIYSGRGYHIRVLDPAAMQLNSEVRSQILKYVSGAFNPKNRYYMESLPGQKPYELEHFTIPVGYSAVFTDRIKYIILHLTGEEEIDQINPRLLKDVMQNRHFLEEEKWGLFKNKIGPRRYKNLVDGIAKLNLGLVDAKVSIDLKRILRLPTSLHSKVSMKCMKVDNIENFDPLKEAVPKFVRERKEF